MDFDYFGDRPHDIALEHRRRINAQIHERFRLRDQNDPLNLSVTEFNRLYRMPQDAVVELRNILHPYVHIRRNPQQTSLFRKVLAGLSFLGMGVYQRLIGRSIDCSMSQTSVSRAIQEVVMALNHADVLTRFIHFPLTRIERAPIIQRNEALGMEGVLAFLDCTLIRLSCLRNDNEKQGYYTRKGWTGLNVQIMCDADLNILNVDARFPGSLNDNLIWEASSARAVVEEAYWQDRCWVLGDSGYFTAPWLHVPIPHAVPGTPEYDYTVLHCHCRNAVERCIGVLKERWRCLCVDRIINYKNAAYAGLIVNACCVLHNFCMQRGIVPMNPIIEDLGVEVPVYNPLPVDVQERGLAELQYLVNYAHQRRLHRDNIINVL